MNNKLLIIISLVFFILFKLTTGVFAITADEVKVQIEDINKQIEDLDKEIEKYKNQIVETGQQKNTLSNTIKSLTLTRNSLLKERTQIEKKISLTNIAIDKLNSNIKTKEEIISTSYSSISRMIYDIHQEDEISFLEKILSEKKLKDVTRQYNNKIELNEKLRENILDLNNQKEELTETKLEKEDEQEKLTALKNTLKQKEQAVIITKKEKDALLLQTKNKETEYQKMLAEQIKRRDAFEKELEEYESQLKFILDPNSIPKEGSEALSWPLDYILVTSTYGERWGRFHYGLDFRASVGTRVKAMAKGEVLGIGNTDTACQGASFGRWVFIKYDNGLASTYGHLSSINVKVGDKVNAEDVIGLSGGTKGVFGSGTSTGPHLHVSVYASNGVNIDNVPSKTCNGKIFTQPVAAKNAHLNPALYLPPITSSMIKK